MKKILLRIFCGLLIFSSVACEPANTSTPVPSETSEISAVWVTTWLTQPACKPPCWQNIHPGVTTIEEALAILENLPDATITYNEKDGVVWDFGSTNNEGGWLNIQDGIVDSIILDAVRSKLTLETVVDSFGYPNYVVPEDCREGMCDTVLVYPNSGFWVNVFIENEAWKSNSIQVEVLPRTIINRVHFEEFGMEHFKQSYLSPLDNVPIMEWKGYGGYPED